MIKVDSAEDLRFKTLKQIKAGSAQQKASIFEGKAPALNEESGEHTL